MREILARTVFDTPAELWAPEHTALIIIDVQNDFCHPDGHFGAQGKDLTLIKAALPPMASIMDAAREAGLLLVWIQNTVLPDARGDSDSWLRRRTRAGAVSTDWTRDNSWGQQFAAPLIPAYGEIVIPKHRSSAFVGTPLDLILRSNDIRSVVIMGVVTQGCVESTARDASFLDYYVLLLTDCVGTTDPLTHSSSLVCQRERYDFALSAELIRTWQAPRNSN